MITEIFPGLQPQHVILAYVGVLLHILIKLAELKKKNSRFTPKGYLKSNIYTIMATTIMVPLLLVLSTDTSMKDILPINNVTAVLAGWQTQSVFRSLMAIYSGRVSSDDTPNNDNQNP